MRNDQDNDNNIYSIKEVADYFGVSTHTLRYYEKLGVYESERSMENNYRFFSRELVIYLDYVLRMKEMGISIDSIVNIGRLYNVKQSANALNERARAIDRQIEELWRQKVRIRDYLESYQYILESDGNFAVQESPVLICQDVGDSMIDVMTDFRTLSTEYAPKLTFELRLSEDRHSIVRTSESAEGRGLDIQSVTMENEDDLADKIQRDSNSRFYIRPSRTCIHNVIKLGTGSDYSAYDELIAFADSHGYTLTDNPILRTFYISYYSYAYYDLWAPID